MTQMDNEDPSSDPQNLYKSQAPQHTCIILMLVRQRQRQPWGLDRQSKQKKKPQDQREVLKKKKKKRWEATEEGTHQPSSWVGTTCILICMHKCTCTHTIRTNVMEVNFLPIKNHLDTNQVQRWNLCLWRLMVGSNPGSITLESASPCKLTVTDTVLTTVW